jgi:hypothetical protein
MVVEKKEVTSEQEEVIEDVAEAAPEVMAEATTEEVKPTEEMAEVPVEETVTEAPTEAPAGDDRIAKLEAAQEEILSEIAKLRGEVEAPKEEDVMVEMSDNRPMWKRISDGIEAIKKQK